MHKNSQNWLHVLNNIVGIVGILVSYISYKYLFWGDFGSCLVFEEDSSLRNSIQFQFFPCFWESKFNKSGRN